MARYTVHTPARPDLGDEVLERTVFVRDGWSWGAFLFGPFWLAWNRHWITGLIALLVMGGLFAGLAALPVSEGTKAGALLLLMLLWGLEGPSLRRVALARAGFSEVGLVAGGNLDALEQRFFAEQASNAQIPPAEAPSTTTMPGSVTSWGAPVIGLFPDSRKPS